MAMPVKTLKFRSSIKDLNNILCENKFNGFPIVNNDNQCIGLINRHALLVIIKNLEKIKSIGAKED